MKPPYPFASALISIPIILLFADCRRADSPITPPDNVNQTPVITKTVYMEGLRGAFQREDRLLRQLQEHTANFGPDQSLLEALHAARLRMMKIETVMRDNNVEPRIVRLPTSTAASMEDALKKDAALLNDLDLYYTELSGKNIPEINPEIIYMLDDDVKKCQALLERHDTSPPRKP